MCTQAVRGRLEVEAWAPPTVPFGVGVARVPQGWLRDFILPTRNAQALLVGQDSKNIPPLVLPAHL